MRRALGSVLFTILIASTGCGGGSGDPTAPPGSVGPGTMTAQVNGSAWSATITKRAFASGGLITVQGQDGSNRIITIVARASAPGTYSLAIGNGLGHNALYSVVAAAWSTALQGGNGTFTITSLTATQVRGTFSFTAVSNVNGTAPVQVTSGQFDLPIS
ncbi:MAG: DUF6252 family protein [Gemmatimonadaceae bacterium]